MLANSLKSVQIPGTDREKFLIKFEFFSVIVKAKAFMCETD